MAVVEVAVSTAGAGVDLHYHCVVLAAAVAARLFAATRPRAEGWFSAATAAESSWVWLDDCKP